METVQIQCPNCSVQLQFQGEAGQSLQVRCSGCRETLALTVPGAAPQAAELPTAAPVMKPTPVAKPTQAVQPVVARPVTHQPVARQPVTRQPVTHQRPVPRQSHSRPSPSQSLETVYRASPSDRPSASSAPVGVIVACVAGVALIACTVGGLIWFVGREAETADTGAMAQWQQRREIESRAKTPEEMMPWRSSTGGDSIATLPGASGWSSSRSTFSQGSALGGSETAGVSGQRSLSPEQLVDQFFQLVTTAHRTSLRKSSPPFEEWRRQDRVSDELLREAIRLAPVSRSGQVAFEQRFESFRDATGVSDWLRSGESLRPESSWSRLKLLIDFMNAPYFGLSIADDEIPIERYVRYVLALGVVTKQLNAIETREDADAAAAEIQRRARSIIDYAVDEMKGITREGTQIDHPVCEGAYRQCIAYLIDDIRRRGIESPNLMLANQNVRFAMEQVRSEKWIRGTDLIAAFERRPQPILNNPTGNPNEDPGNDPNRDSVAVSMEEPMIPEPMIPEAAQAGGFGGPGIDRPGFGPPGYDQTGFDRPGDRDPFNGRSMPGRQQSEGAAGGPRPVANPVATPEEPPTGFEPDQISDSILAAERPGRIKMFAGADMRRLVVQGVDSDGLPQLAAYLKRMNVEDFFVNRSGTQATIYIRDKQSITTLAGEIDFGRVTMISTRNNEVTVRFNNQ